MSKTIQIMIDKRGAVTNGDVIKAIFPNTKVIAKYMDVVDVTIDVSTRFSKDWWNSPYKEGEE